VTYPNARYGQGTGPIYYNNLICTGSEPRLPDCGNDGLGVIGSCTHNDDAAMFCETRKSSLFPQPLFLLFETVLHFLTQLALLVTSDLEMVTTAMKAVWKSA